jgi:hypothetical protein
MIIGLIALELMATQPALRDSPKAMSQQRPETASRISKQQRLADARAMLTSAKQLRASYTPGPGQPSKADLDASIDQLKDSISEMGEMDQLELQMVMDRMSKAEATLSNLLKKISNTQSAIVQNIK